MVRFVHHELMASVAWLTGIMVGVTAAVVVRGSGPVRGDTVAQAVALVIGLFVLFTLVHASGLKHVSHKRDFETAVALPSDVRLPSNSPLYLLLRLPYPLLFLAPGVFAFFLGNDSLFMALLATEWLGSAAVAVWWEHRHGRLVWRGYVHNEPWRLAYSPLSPPPPTRTATDAPPA
ncbi:hypothetical protein R6V09_30075 [Streptomyces sp. W16]|uniref:hypothetical protein n=1 Tax=Streptomyces sp. W16 TaxID=3076631 RepID=UPI00295AEC37|nr:hypothetical protein [Streptomyces sp. W16]MDV9174343.1 hypothetical protein [Streptomyces sp. W16]